jgi:putative redox protein
MTDDVGRETSGTATLLRRAVLRWTGDLRFEAGEEEGPRVTLDGDGLAGPSPMVTLLAALGACSGADVVSILKKMRVGLDRCDVTVTGERAPDHPRRYVKLHYRFEIAGEGVDQAKAERAVALSVEKYCSVLHTLDRGIPLAWEVVVQPRQSSGEP